MPLFELDDEQRKLLLGVGVGIGAAMLVSMVAPAFRGIGRPLAKAAIKSGIQAFDKSRETLAQFRETCEDLVAEVRAEMEQDILARTTTEGTSLKPEPEGGQ